MLSRDAFWTLSVSCTIQAKRRRPSSKCYKKSSQRCPWFDQTTGPKNILSGCDLPHTQFTAVKAAYRLCARTRTLGRLSDGGIPDASWLYLQPYPGRASTKSTEAMIKFGASIDRLFLPTDALLMGGGHESGRICQ
jgi:hypothetical protein